MNIKHILLTAIASAAALTLSAQSQGYLDGIEYFKVGQFDKAQIILARTLNDAETDQALALYYLGAVELQNGNTNAAATYFNKGISKNPKCGFNYVGLGAIELKKGNIPAAKAQFKLAVKNEKTAPVYVAIARAYYDTDAALYAKDYEAAMADAFKKDKTCTDYFIMRGDKLQAEDKIGEAAAAYDNAIYYKPNTPEAYVKYATAYIHANPDFAIEKLKELNKLTPNSALAQSELAEKFYDNDQLTNAAIQYDRYMENPNHFQKDEERHAQLLYFAKQYPRSIERAQTILAKDPQNFSMHRIMFLNMADTRDYQAARSWAEKLFSLDPEKAKNRFTTNDYTSYGEVLQKLGEDSLAVVAFAQAVELSPEKADLIKNLSTAYYNAKKYPEAAAAFKRYLEVSKSEDLNDYFFYAGRLMGAINSYDPETQADERNTAFQEALQTIDHLIAENPSNPNLHQRRAVILILGNNNQVNPDVVASYQKCLDLLDEDPENVTTKQKLYREALLQTGRYYLQSHDNDNARRAFGRLIQIDPDNAAGYQQTLDKLK